MIKIYGRDNPPCPQCKAAKQYCVSNDIEYTYFDISEDGEARSVVMNSTLRSLPVIFEDDSLVGSFDDLKAQGELF